MIGESRIGQPGIIESGAGESRVPTFAAPGMIADRAQTWSVAQERSAADLSFDFVTPELVLAARVYGLGPAEAAQAMRLAIAGPSQLAAMASTVNRTFVQAMAIEAARSEQGGATAPITAYPAACMRLRSVGRSVRHRCRHARRSVRAADRIGDVRRRAQDAARRVHVAVCDRRCTRAIGRCARRRARHARRRARAARGPIGRGARHVRRARFRDARVRRRARSFAKRRRSAHARRTRDDAAGHARRSRRRAAAGGEPSETDVLTSATSMVASSRRAKFEAMYIALGQNAQARSWSPAAKAARALALAGRGDESITALERAQIAWSVLPLVAPTLIGAAFGAGSDEPGAVQSTGTQTQRAAMRRHVELQQEQLLRDASRGPGSRACLRAPVRRSARTSRRAMASRRRPRRPAAWFSRARARRHVACAERGTRLRPHRLRRRRALDGSVRRR